MSEHANEIVMPSLQINNNVINIKLTDKKKKKRKRTPPREPDDDETEAGEQSDSRKRKRSIPTKLKITNSTTEVIPVKRPRGRPPLNITTNTVVSTIPIVAPVIRIPSRSHAKRIDHIDTSNAPIIVHTNNNNSKIKVSIDTTENETKTTRPHSALVTQRILSRLMTDGPLSVVDIVGSGSDSPPRDLVQSILDILQVLSVVVQLKVDIIIT